VSVFALGERYHHGDGVIYRADPRVKIVVAVLFAFAITAIPEGHWLAFAGFGGFTVVAIALSKLPPGLVLRRAFVALPFVAAAIPRIFSRAGETVFTTPLIGWTASREGMIAVGSILLKSWLAVLMAVVLTSCTQPLDLIRGLERLRMPRILASTVFFMYRYLFVIGGEGQRLMRARESRSAVLESHRSGVSATWRAKVLGNMIGSLFIRSFERSERIYAAMQARGYDGTMRFIEERTLVRADWILLASSVIAMGGLVLYARL
jgi:cobalt/nickel transport system permease protein